MHIGGEPMYGSMPTVTGLRLADSKTEPMIEMADLLCGFVRTVFKKIKKGQELTAAGLRCVSTSPCVETNGPCGTPTCRRGCGTSSRVQRSEEHPRAGSKFRYDLRRHRLAAL